MDANWRSWRAGVILPLLLLAGCRGLWDHPPFPKDPMFLSRRPLAGKKEQSRPTALAYAEPAPPAMPAEFADRVWYAQRPTEPNEDRVILSGPPETDTLPETPRWPRPVPGVLTNRPMPRGLSPR